MLPIALFAAACAEQPEQISPMYVSSNVYSGKSCRDLLEERREVVAQVNTLTAEQKKSANNDAAAMAVGMILFWPALFAINMSGDKKQQLAAAKGNYEAIERRMKEKGCRYKTST